jgi:hypothetical protein
MRASGRNERFHCARTRALERQRVLVVVGKRALKELAKHGVERRRRSLVVTYVRDTFGIRRDLRSVVGATRCQNMSTG